jgi:hypothetical protein
MSTIVQRALAAQRLAVKRLDGRLVKISREAVFYDNVPATIGETRSEDYIEDQIISTVRVRDFLIDVADYRLGTPQAGDLVTYQDEVWEVQPTSAEPEYRRSDRDGSTWRIHTKRKATL